MKVRIIRTQDDGRETEENVRYTDEVGEAEGMTDAQIDAMERELKTAGRFWLSATRCARPMR